MKGLIIYLKIRQFFWLVNENDKIENKKKCESLIYEINNKNITTIICEFSFNLLKYKPGIFGIKIFPFKANWKFGNKFPLSNKLRFTWSNSKGQLVIFEKAKDIIKNLDKIEKCNIIVNEQAFINENDQKVSFVLIAPIKIILENK